MAEGSQESPASAATLGNPPVPVRMLNEFPYCSRPGYLMRVQWECAGQGGQLPVSGSSWRLRSANDIR